MAPRADESPGRPQLTAQRSRKQPALTSRRVARRVREHRQNSSEQAGKCSLYPLERRPTPLHALLHKLSETAEPPRARDSARNVFSDLNRLLGYVEQLKAALDSSDDTAGPLFLLEALRA